MVLGTSVPGRVGRRRISLDERRLRPPLIGVFGRISAAAAWSVAGRGTAVRPRTTRCRHAPSHDRRASATRVRGRTVARPSGGSVAAAAEGVSGGPPDRSGAGLGAVPEVRTAPGHSCGPGTATPSVPAAGQDRARRGTGRARARAVDRRGAVRCAQPIQAVGARVVRRRVPERVKVQAPQLVGLVGAHSAASASRVGSAMQRRRSPASASARPVRSWRRSCERCRSCAEGRELYGLTLYRLGRWKDAARELDAFVELSGGSTEQHPVLADCRRALRQYGEVDRLWEELRESSPSGALVAEGRIVTAGSLADRGDLGGAVRLLAKGFRFPKRADGAPPAPCLRAGRPVRALRRHPPGAGAVHPGRCRPTRTFLDAAERLQRCSERSAADCRPPRRPLRATGEPVTGLRFGTPRRCDCDRGVQRRVELGVALLGRQALGEGPGEAGDHAGVARRGVRWPRRGCSRRTAPRPAAPLGCCTSSV